MIIDMVTMYMMQVAIMNIVHVIAVTDHQVTVIGAVHMIGMHGRIHGRLTIRIGLADLKHMLIDMIAVNKVQMPIVEVIPVIIVPDPLMPAAIPVHMRMVLMNLRGVIFWGNGAGA